MHRPAALFASTLLPAHPFFSNFLQPQIKSSINNQPINYIHYYFTSVGGGTSRPLGSKLNHATTMHWLVLPSILILVSPILTSLKQTLHRQTQSSNTVITGSI
jgi:hypothetical protein